MLPSYIIYTYCQTLNVLNYDLRKSVLMFDFAYRFKLERDKIVLKQFTIFFRNFYSENFEAVLMEIREEGT